jgi:hypothetical protein
MKWIVIGLVLLGVWVVVTFIAPVGLGVVHVLLGAGVLLLIRGWVELNPQAASS